MLIKFDSVVRARPALWVPIGLAALALAQVASSCATQSKGDVKYPPRAPACELAVYSTPVPGVPVWDDLGIAEGACNMNQSPAECMRELHAEACRMGGDILYNVPRHPFRPRDQVMVYRGQVAHTRPGSTPQKANDDDLPPPATPEESAKAVVPLGTEARPAGPATSPPDAGDAALSPLTVPSLLRLRPAAGPFAPTNSTDGGTRASDASGHGG